MKPFRSNVLAIETTHIMPIPRTLDIQPLAGETFTIQINGQPIPVARGETILSALNAAGLRGICRTDHQQTYGSYCGMGICHCCLVYVDGHYKRRACQTVVHPGMQVETGRNRHDTEALT
jgi:hydrogen cyanide synthase HcnA